MDPAPVEILLIEDNPNDAELTMYALQKKRLADHIVLLRDGTEVFDFLFGEGERTGHDGAEMPKLILLDLKLPKIDGIDVLRRLKTDPRTKSIPVVMLTSSREERDIAESYQQGVNSYIVKPVDFDQFTKAVQEIGTYWLTLNEQMRPRRKRQEQR